MMKRALAAALAAVAVGGLIASCADDTPAPAATASSTSRSTSATVQPAAHSELERIAAVQLCRNVITSAGAMVRDYNVFISKLNELQSYAKIGSEDQWAEDTLTTGADVVRKAIGPATPTDLVSVVNRFVDESEELAERIDAEQMGGLNTASATWGSGRTAALDKCSEFLPTK